MQSTLHVALIRGQSLPSADSNGFSDPYVVLRLDGEQKQKSETILKTLNPEWSQNFYFNEKLGSLGQTLFLEVWDRDAMSADKLGVGEVDVSTLASGVVTSFEVDLVHNKHPGSARGKLFLTCERRKETPLDANVKRRESEVKSTSGMGIGSMISNVKKQTAKALSLMSDLHTNGGKGVKRMITVDVIRARGVPPMDIGSQSCDAYVRLKIGKKKHTTKTRFRTLMPEWKERFVFVLFDMGGRDSHVLDLGLYDKDTVGMDEKFATLKVDLSQLTLGLTDERYWKCTPHESKNLFGFTKKHHVKPDAETVADVELLLLITVADLFETQLAPDQLALAQKSSKGWLKVNIHKARDLAALDSNGKSDPFVVIELGNRHMRTFTVQADLNPEWESTVEMPVQEIFDTLVVQVYDEDANGKFQLIGNILLPLLDIENGKRQWFQLKDAHFLHPAQGCIQLSFHLNYLKLPLLAKCMDRRPVKLMQKDAPFKVSTLKSNIHRLTYFALIFLKAAIFLDKISSWQLGPPTTTIGFIIFWILFWLFVHLWHLPFVALLCLLLAGMKKFRRKNVTLFEILQTAEEEELVDEETEVAEDDEDEAGDAKAALKNPLGMYEQVRQMKVMARTVQNLLGTIASNAERVLNLCSWESPWLTGILCLGLFFMTLGLVVVPFRYWAMLGMVNRVFFSGLKKFHPKFKRPAYYIPYSPLLEFIGRVPDNLELEQRRPAELPIELQTGTVSSLQGS